MSSEGSIYIYIYMSTDFVSHLCFPSYKGQGPTLNFYIVLNLIVFVHDGILFVQLVTFTDFSHRNFTLYRMFVHITCMWSWLWFCLIFHKIIGWWTFSPIFVWEDTMFIQLTSSAAVSHLYRMFVFILKMYRQLELRMSNLQVVELSHISQISEFVQLTTFKDFQWRTLCQN